MSLLIAAVIATLITLAYGRYRLTQVQRDWEGLLSPEARGQLDEVRARMIVDAAMADDALLGAEAARTTGDWAEACRLVDLGVWALDQATPDRLTRLRAIASAVRMAAAIMPPPPVHPRLFGTREVRTTTALGLALHNILITPAERMLLRVTMLSWAFRLAMRVARRSAAALRLRPAAAEHWSRFVDGREDWRAADEEHLASLRLLLQSVASASTVESIAR